MAPRLAPYRRGQRRQLLGVCFEKIPEAVLEKIPLLPEVKIRVENLLQLQIPHPVCGSGIPVHRKNRIERGLIKRAAFRPRIVAMTPEIDFAEVLHEGRVTVDVAREALDRLNIDRKGLDEMDKRLLDVLIDKFDGQIGRAHV